MDIHNWNMDIHNCIQNWIVDIHLLSWIMCIHDLIMGIDPQFRFGYPFTGYIRSWLFISVCIDSISVDTRRK